LETEAGINKIRVLILKKKSLEIARKFGISGQNMEAHTQHV